MSTIGGSDVRVSPRTSSKSLAGRKPYNEKLKFGKNNDFHTEVRRRVDEYFQSSGRCQRDCWQMYVKSAVLLSMFVGTWVMLVFIASTWWQALPLAILIGLTSAGIGFNIQHDAGHQAYSSRPWVNKLMALSLDLIGGSSYIWHWKHAVVHHNYVNITGHDSDIDLGVLGRLTPDQRHRVFHRWQHFYMWPLYGMMAIKWHLFDDYRDVLTGRIGQRRIPRPKSWDLAVFVIGKLVFFMLAFGIPMMFHDFWIVVGFYAIAAVALGITLSVVFQLAHAVGTAEFPLPHPGTGRIENAWAVHQTETTVDFARRSRVVAWLLGGLNFQIEHHLFPRISHINYPAISPIVEATCRDFGVSYTEHESFRAGLGSHFRWLRLMGRGT